MEPHAVHREHHIDMVKGDIAPTVLIAGDPARVEVFAGLMDEARKVAEKREYITYTGRKDGTPISCTCTGLGCPATAIGVEELIHIGAQNIIRIGTCGPIQPDLKPGAMVIATGAVRGDHTSEEYISMEYPAVADYRVVRALIDACKALGLPHRTGIIRSHDAYYMESSQAFGDFKARIQKWIDMGVLCLENESSALYVVSSISGIRAGTILTGGYPIYEQDADEVDGTTNIRNMVHAGIEAAKLLAERGLA